MKNKRTSTKITPSVKYQDKTNWKRVFNQSQNQSDQNAAKDTENPVLSNVRFTKVNRK